MKKGNNCVKLNEYFLIVIVLLFVLIGVKIVYVAVSPAVDGIDLKALALSNRTASKTIRASRGTIYDINAEVLAGDVRSYTVIAYLSESRTSDVDNPHHVVEKEATAKSLSPLLEVSEEYILERLNEDKYQVEFGASGRAITELKKQAIEALDLPGIDFIEDSKRDYPNGDFASYLIGYARKNDQGIIAGEMGIESKYDDMLKGIDGKITYEKDAYGYKMAGKMEVIEPASNGYDIYLTIDSNIQMYLENAIMEMEKKGLEWATFTIADAKSGAIIASSSSPSFDPNVLEIENYSNPLTSYAYEPGSTMKIFSFMAAMESGKYNGDKLYQSGNIVVDDYKISDWNNYGWGKISFDTGFIYSSNTAAVRIGQSIGRDYLTDFYENLGFNQKTKIELPNEYEGSLELVYESELASASYGQGITTTPIQNIQALTTLTNNGTTMKPYLISKIVDSSTGEVVYEGQKTEINKVASKDTINKILDLMDLVVNNEDRTATGVGYHTDAVTLVGKTGTAQYTKADGKYSSGTFNNIRSFSGVFPKENPEYIIYFSVKDFIGSSSDLGRITKSVVESIAKYKNLSEHESKVDKAKIVTVKNYINSSIDDIKKSLDSSGLVPIIIGTGDIIINQSILKNTKVIHGTKILLLTSGNEYHMPNVIGWSSSEIINLANLLKLSYNINGFGKVVNVSILPDQIINQEDILNITLDSRSVVNEKEEDKEKEQI
ncbi:MAG: penicillin-binding transpeptidase domain-containing protein [Bacilli bacterium]|nr:penicillin-binding transpeptidase domain-containing protein [Bacilli bacterium]